MGFQARKSFKVMPGVRMTVSKSGISTSAGVRGARVTRTSSGRVTRTVGLPGSGMSHTKSIGGAASPRSSSAPSPAAAKPGLTSPKWEKELHKAVTNARYDDLPRIASAYPEAAFVAGTIEGLHAYGEDRQDRARELLQWVWDHGGDVETNPFVAKYLSGANITVPIAEGVDASLPFGRDVVGLALTELLQDAGDVDSAIGVVERLDPSTVAAVSLSELYVLAGRFGEVVELTNGMQNVDDATALLLTFRGVALREEGHHTASREAFKEALKSKSRDAGIRHLALLERAKSYLAEGKNAQARKDLERILAEDSAFPGIREAIAELPA